MGTFLTIFNIFNFVRKFRKENKKYRQYGSFRKILNFIFDLLIACGALGLCYLAFWLFSKTYDPNFNKIVAWGCGALAAISAIYFVTLSFENCIIASIIAFTSALSLKEQDEQAIKNVFDSKELRSHDTRGLDVLLGFLNLILSMALLAGIIVTAVLVF